MEKEKRHLIQEKVEMLTKKYDTAGEEAKEKGDTCTALAMFTASKAILELSLEILKLDAEGKI